MSTLPVTRDTVLSYEIGQYGLLALALASLVADCYEEVRPYRSFLNATSTMRISSIVIVSLLAIDEGYAYLNPSIRSRQWSKTRVVFTSMALLLVCLSSTREGSVTVRTTESIYVVATLFLSVVSPLLTDKGLIVSTRLGPKIRTCNAYLLSTFAIFAYIGARLIRNGLFMCEEAMDQVLHPLYGFKDTEMAASVGRLCVACNGWSAASLAVSGSVLFFCSVGCLFVLNNHQEIPPSVTYTDDLKQQYRDMNGLLRLCLGVYASSILSGYMALADCISNTQSTFDHYSCSIGGEVDCPDQLVEFRRLGFVQHSSGTNTLAFIGLVVTTLRIEQVLSRLQGYRMLFARSGVSMASLLVLVLVVARVSVAGWTVEGYIELSFIVVLIGTALTSIYYTREMFASVVIYAGLAIDYIYYCNEYSECRSYRYLTNVSNMVMGVLFFVILGLDIVSRLFKYTFGGPSQMGFFTTASQYVDALLGILSVFGLSIALCLALLVTAALAAYDGSNVDEVVIPMVSLVNAGMLEQQSVLRFILWHYAPLIAWASLRQRMIMRHEHEVRESWTKRAASGEDSWPWHSKFIVMRSAEGVNWIRLIVWISAIVFDGVLWVLYKHTSTSNTETPTAYPMSQVFMLTVTVVPPWLLLAT